MANKKKASETLASELGELSDEELRIKIEEGLLKKRAVKRDLDAYSKGAREVIRDLDAIQEACLDEAQARHEKAGKGAKGAKASKAA